MLKIVYSFSETSMYTEMSISHTCEMEKLQPVVRA